ncbi:MAG: c-type cytochrome [Gemmataceae bacterium]|nr:c-type cytochrome [Gemmataceae bacterium]
MIRDKRPCPGWIRRAYHDGMNTRLSPRLLVPSLLFALAWASAGPSQDGKFPPVVNTQNPNDIPPTPQQALAKITVPRGFHVTLFAGEPDVRQPISMAFDDRGRLWVAECYTYAAAGTNYSRAWDEAHRDRVLIFEDTDHDGRFDKRTAFWDRAQNLTSVAYGFGGAWVLCAPRLLFIPDRDRDGKPDGEPEVILDGFALKGIGHNIVNGLTWGPDGWLYGRHGILATANIGPPGTPEAQRVKINCGIWRYHPTRKVVEAVAHGTTNPWGLDFDDHGQLFFTNNVNGHLWHLIPGAHYKRMYGEDLRPRLYDLIDQHADHQHWDPAKPWHDSRDGKGEHGKRGGGHSHVGAMIYLGDNWPDHYRNTLFTCNTHGRRVNNDRLVRSGSGYVGLHGEDFLFANDPWFRGVDIRSGPDGGVFISDWSDLGECHDHDGVHRTSGRIYKVVYGKPKPPPVADVARLSDPELVKLQLHRNDWYVRHARRHLQQRAAAGKDMKAVHAELRKLFEGQREMSRKLRALWALYVTGGTDESWLRGLLGHENEHVRTWGVRLLVDQGSPGPETLKQFVRLGREDLSGLVRLFLASALQRLPVGQRAELAEALLGHSKDAADHNLPLMLWYGIEPLASADPPRAVELAASSRIPLVRRFITRRLTEEVEKSPGPVNDLLKRTAASGSADFHLDVLRGMAEALRGWRKARPPEAWASLQAKLAASPDKRVREQARDLGVVFGDGRAVDELRRLAADGSADPEARRAALRVLVESRSKDLVPLLQRLIGDRATAGVAARGLAAYDHPDTAKLILRHYQFLKPQERAGALDTLVSRPQYAEQLLQAVGEGKVAAADVSAYHARQIRSLGRDNLNRLLGKLWGEVRGTAEEKRKEIARYKARLTPARLKGADLSRGRLVYDQVCASCHVLYGQGKAVGPELTGSNRDHLDYLLENIVDPSAILAADFRMSVVTLKDGRVLTGVVGPQIGRTLALQTQTEKVVIERSEVERVRPTTQSLMPDGLLAPLRDEQVRDLFAYLMGREQVPLPPGAK